MKRSFPAPVPILLLAALAVSACAMGTGQPRLANPDPASNPPSTAGDRSPPADGVISVRPGDTVYAVARQYGVSPRAIIEANKLSPPYLLHVGDRLFLPLQREHVVKAGDTLSVVARDYRVDFAQLASLNGLRSPYAIRVGQRLRIPGPAVAPAETVVAARPPQSPPSPGPVAVAPPDPTRPWSSEGSLNFPVAKDAPAPARGAPPVPAPRPSGPAPSSGTVVIVQAPTPAPAPPPAASPGASAGAVTAPEPTTVATAPPDPAPAPAPTAAPPAAAEPASDQTSRAIVLTPPARGASRFLWPVDGRVIAGFGPREGGLHNDGINIAAATGTKVKAAENGVVVYAGNELRGFGNLLLIKHADGWTTAYAHAETLLVRRGDRVSRGQVIATVGQTGNVDRPQLHFEIRKGPRAVDPRDELGAARSTSSALPVRRPTGAQG